MRLNCCNLLTSIYSVLFLTFIVIVANFCIIASFFGISNILELSDMGLHYLVPFLHVYVISKMAISNVKP